MKSIPTAAWSAATGARSSTKRPRRCRPTASPAPATTTPGRWPISSGFELPAGLARDLLFHADAVPALGYRTYRLRPRAEPPVFADGVTAAATTLESPRYRLELDSATGFARRILDRETGHELVDAKAAHPFGAVLVRDPHGGPEMPVLQRIEAGRGGPLSGSLCAVFATRGHPRIEVTYTLFADEKRLDVAVALLKDPTPLLETYVAFPFHMPRGRFRYEGPLCAVDPACDLLPGAYADRLTAQNWVAVSDGDQSILWSSHDAPVVSLARLWPGRVSPAHSAVIRADLVHPRQTADDLRGGAIYSLLTANNFGTNFAVSQSGALLFRYSLTSLSGEIEAFHRRRDAGANSLPPCRRSSPGIRGRGRCRQRGVSFRSTIRRFNWWLSSGRRTVRG